MALGDSIEVSVLAGPGPNFQRFSRAEIAHADVRPMPVSGEKAMQVVFIVPIVALGLLWYGLRGYE